MLSGTALAASAVALAASAAALAVLVPPALAREVLSLGLAELLRPAAPPLSGLLVLPAAALAARLAPLRLLPGPLSAASPASLAALRLSRLLALLAAVLLTALLAGLTGLPIAAPSAGLCRLSALLSSGLSVLFPVPRWLRHSRSR